MNDVVETRRLKRHPIRGILGGLIVALGAAILLALFGAADFTAWWPFALILGGGALLGLLVGLFAPAL